VWGWDSHFQKWKLGALRDSRNFKAWLQESKPRFEVFFIPLKISWSVDVENGLAWTIRTSATQVMVERKVRSQIASLTPDHKKLGINSTPVCAGRVRHTVGKLLKRATSLLQTSSQLEIWARSYELPKSRKSKPGQFQDSSLGVPGLRAIWMRVSRNNAEDIIWRRWWLPPSPGRGESSESMLPMICPNTKSDSECELTNLWLGLMQDQITK